MFAETGLFQEYIVDIGLALYLTILVSIFFFRAHYYRSLIDKIKEPGVSMMLHGVLALFMGVFLVLTHNIWSLTPRVFVTILCWVFLVNAMLWLAIPIKMLELLKKVASGRGYYVALVVIFVFSAQILTRLMYIYLNS